MTYQSAINITSQNIANLQNPEYSRQVPVIVANTLDSATNITKDLSMGIKLQDIDRIRDELLNGYYRVENNTLNDLETTNSLYREVEFIFNELGDFKLLDGISEFWKSWQMLQETPEDMSLRKNIIQVGGFLADALRSKSGQLATLSETLNLDIDFEIRQVNDLLGQLADVNKNIVKSSRQSSGERNMLLDRKDALLDSLSSKVAFQIVTSDDSSVNLYLNGIPMFFKDELRTLSFVQEGGGWKLKLSTGETVQTRSGKIHSLQNMRDTIIEDYRAQLDSLASHLIESVNQMHRNGYARDDTKGVAFFSGSGASDIKVAISDPVKVAAALATLESKASVSAAGKSVDALASMHDEAGDFRTTPTSTGGVFRINGVDFTWDDSMTLQDVVNAVNGSTAGVKAAYDSSLQTMRLVRDPFDGTTPDIVVEDISGDFTAFTQLAGATLNTNSQGSGENALALSQLWHRKVVGNPPSRTINEEYRGLVDSVAREKSHLENLYNNKKRLVDNIAVQRQGESTVSLDEELISLMKFQQAYAASTRIITVVDEMLDRLINETGRVGR
jgi:flagellar hook-associated protein 1 FlgK